MWINFSEAMDCTSMQRKAGTVKLWFGMEISLRSDLMFSRRAIVPRYK